MANTLIKRVKIFLPERIKERFMKDTCRIKHKLKAFVQRMPSLSAIIINSHFTMQYIRNMTRLEFCHSF